MGIVVVIVVLVIFALAYWLLMSPTAQVLGRYPWRIKTIEKVVAITFDDGPNEPYTSQIADFLAEKKIKATFFQVGTCVDRNPEVTKRLYSDGHIIGNHSMHHRFRDHLIHPSYKNEIMQNQEIIYKYIGKRPALFRSPWLWRQPWLFSTAHKQSLQPISGKFSHSFEVFQPKGERIAKRTLRKVKPGSIIIFHDGFDSRGGNRSQTVKAVKITVDQLLQQGYRFVTISELLGIPAYQ